MITPKKVVVLGMDDETRGVVHDMRVALKGFMKTCGDEGANGAALRVLGGKALDRAAEWQRRNRRGVEAVGER